MKFRVYVDPASALRVGNERIREQFVEISLSELSGEQREVVAASHLIGEPPCVDLTRMPVGDQIAATRDLKIAVANREAVLGIIQIRLDADAELKRLEKFAEDNFEKAIGPVIAEHNPRPEIIGEDSREGELIVEWMQRNYPSALAHDLGKRGKPAIEESFDGGLLGDVTDLLDVRIGDEESFELRGPDGEIEISIDDLPEDEVGQNYLLANIARLMRDPARARWVSTEWAKRRTDLEAEFIAELDSKRKDIEALIEEMFADEALEEKERLEMLEIIKDADAKRPDEALLERFEAGVLPEEEIAEVVNEFVFGSIKFASRFEGILETEVKHLEGQTVEFLVAKSSDVRAQEFKLAKRLAEDFPQADFEHIRHLAIVDGEVAIERHAVRVSLVYAGCYLIGTFAV